MEKDVTIEIDCQKYLSLSELLKNPLLKSMVGQQFKDADLRKIEFLAENCNQILRQGLQNENQPTWSVGVIGKGSSFLRGLCLMKWPFEMLQNLAFFNMKTHVVYS